MTMKPGPPQAFLGLPAMNGHGHGVGTEHAAGSIRLRRTEACDEFRAGRFHTPCIDVTAGPGSMAAMPAACKAEQAIVASRRPV